MKLHAQFAIAAILMALAGCKSPQAGTTPSSAAPSSPETTAVVSAVVIPARTSIEVRLDQELSTAVNLAGDKFAASLAVPLETEGREVLPRNTRLQGHVTTSHSSGRMKGRAVIGITLDSIEYKGQIVPITTTLDVKTSEAHKKRNIEIIGGGSGVGALIGAIAGGGKGAAIGAAAGAGAGTAGAAATGKQDVRIPAETLFRFQLKTQLQLP